MSSDSKDDLTRVFVHSQGTLTAVSGKEGALLLARERAALTLAAAPLQEHAYRVLDVARKPHLVTDLALPQTSVAQIEKVKQALEVLEIPFSTAEQLPTSAKRANAALVIREKDDGVAKVKAAIHSVTRVFKDDRSR